MWCNWEFVKQKCRMIQCFVILVKLELILQIFFYRRKECHQRSSFFCIKEYKYILVLIHLCIHFSDYLNKPNFFVRMCLLIFIHLIYSFFSKIKSMITPSYLKLTTRTFIENNCPIFVFFKDSF